MSSASNLDARECAVCAGTTQRASVSLDLVSSAPPVHRSVSRTNSRATNLHLIDLGSVGCALLDSFTAGEVCLIAASDRSGSAFARYGLDPRANARGLRSPRSRARRAAFEQGTIGWNAALGGTGSRLVRELGALAAESVVTELVANASTSAWIEALEDLARDLDLGLTGLECAPGDVLCCVDDAFAPAGR